MAEYQLEYATRHVRRSFARAIGKSVTKILTELITNADDSYRRLEETIQTNATQTDVAKPAPITIVFERSKRRFSVIDQAQGLTDIEMREKFVTYGQESSDRAQGFRTRSLFGKGLRDVLFTQHHGQVKSIKDGWFYNCRFRWKDHKGQEKPTVDIKVPTKVTGELRAALGIPGNGTLVEFQLADTVPNPRPQKLLEDLSRFYMLRMINSSPRREVTLRIEGGRGKKRHDIRVIYRFPSMTLASRLNEELQTDIGEPIKIDGEIGWTDKELTQGEVGYVEREGGLLILDEDDAVLDLNLFGYDDDPGARRITGIVRLNGAGAYIRAKLNQKEPEEILTETRDGFDKTHAFYRALRDRMRPQLEPLVAKLRDFGAEPKEQLSTKTMERHQRALEILNRLASEMLGKTAAVPSIPAILRVPPPEGIAFLNSHIAIQAGVSTPAVLLVNTSVLGPSDTIDVFSDTAGIVVSPDRIVVGDDQGENGVQTRIVRVSSDYSDISGRVVASWKHVQAAMNVVTTGREVVTPLNGLEFERDDYAVRVGAKRHLKLFVDLDKIPLGSEMALSIDDESVIAISSKLQVSKTDTITDRVAQIQFVVKGARLAKGVIVTASALQYVSGTRVSVVKREKHDTGKAGLFKGYKFQPLDRKIQSLYVAEGSILINSKDPVNERYFGEEPYKAVEEELNCQSRLADLVLNECLWIMVSQALESGKLDRRFPNNPEIDVRNYVDEKKFEIGNEIHNLFVTKG